MQDSEADDSATGNSSMRETSRARLPATRSSITHHFSVNGHEGYVIVGFYADGRPGEVFIKMAKKGSTVRGLTDAIGVLTSVALQHEVPLEELAKKFENARFEPSGFTKNPGIRHATSLLDYIFQWLRSEDAKRKESVGSGHF